MLAMADYGLANYGQPPYWQAQLPSSIHTNTNYRKVPSRVTKPSSAGNSPLAHARPRNMSAYHGPRVMSDALAPTKQRPRPTSWHPAMRQHSPYYVPNCHPSWLRDVSVSDLEPQQPDMTSMFGLSTPLTCPLSGDLLSTNDFCSEPSSFLPPAPQIYTPVEPPDMLFSDPSEWSTFDSSLSTYPWMQHQMASTDYYGQESVASADDLTAPPTPDPNPQDCRLIAHDGNAHGDDLVALGLYDEPQPLSFGSALLTSGGGDDDFAYHRTGKGLKLEETFTPAPEADDDDDDDDDAEEEEEEEEEDEDADADAEDEDE